MPRGGHIYTCSTDTRDRDQSEIKRSSYKIGDDQAIKAFICTAQIKVKMGPIFDSTHPRLAINGQGSFSGAIKRSRSKNGPDQILIPVTGVSTAGIYVTTPCWEHIWNETTWASTAVANVSSDCAHTS